MMSIALISKRHLNMVKAGDVVVSAATGETFQFVQTSADTDGRLLQIDMIIAPGGGAKAAPMHIHPKSEERFYIQKGELTYVMNGKQGVAKAGDTVIIPPNVPHTWFNDTDRELLFRVEIEPAMDMEKLFEGLGGAVQAGVIVEGKQASPFLLAMTIHKYPDNLYLAGVPVWLQKPVMAVLAWIGCHIVGYQEVYEYTPTAQMQPSALDQARA
jgi:quercetin dioxygenase-like cupin family protein